MRVCYFGITMRGVQAFRCMMYVLNGHANVSCYSGGSCETWHGAKHWQIAFRAKNAPSLLQTMAFFAELDSSFQNSLHTYMFTFDIFFRPTLPARLKLPFDIHFSSRAFRHCIGRQTVVVHTALVHQTKILRLV
jgi:hypothetical protein